MGNDTAAEIRGQTEKADIAILLYKGFKNLISVAMCYIIVVLGIVPCVKAIAGQETITNIVINFLGEIISTDFLNFCICSSSFSSGCGNGSIALSSISKCAAYREPPLRSEM